MPAKTHLVLVAGQSNALGAGTGGQPFPGGWEQTDQIQIWNQSVQNIQNYVPGLNSDDPQSRGPVWGPEAEYCRARHEFTNDHLTIVKVAVGGSCMHPSTERPHWSPDAIGGLCSRLIIQTKFADELQTFRGFNAVPDVLLLMQGEMDASEIWGPLWGFYSKKMLRAIRDGLDAPDLRILVGRIFPFWDAPNRVRKCQTAVANSMHNAVWINMDDVETGDGGGHANAAGMKEMGARFWAADKQLLGNTP